MKKVLLISAIQILILVLFACNAVKDKNKPQSIDKVLAEQKELLIGQDLHSVMEITGEIDRSTNVCLFIYSSNDCDDCLSQGFKIVNYIDSSMVNPKVYVIT